jgi:hypothetical protein
MNHRHLNRTTDGVGLFVVGVASADFKQLFGEFQVEMPGFA